jgi:hypothetical protein
MLEIVFWICGSLFLSAIVVGTVYASMKLSKEKAAYVKHRKNYRSQLPPELFSGVMDGYKKDAEALRRDWDSIMGDRR